MPQIGCSCEVCESTDRADTRTRCSLWIIDGPTSVIIDTGPDFRSQCLQNSISHISAIFYTHFHADHVFGVDDIRAYTCLQDQKIPIYLPDFMEERFRACFGYTITEQSPGLTRPKFLLNTIQDQTIRLDNLSFEPAEISHGSERVKGYVFSNGSVRVAYLIDCKSIPEETMEKLKGVDILILSALWKTEKTHPAHLNLTQAIELSRRIGPRTATYLSHISHQMGVHVETQQNLPENILLAHDGLEIDLG